MNVDVKVPSVSRVFEFDLNEEIMISDIQTEILEIVSQKIHMPLEKSNAGILLLHAQSKRILNAYQTLVQAGVKNGDMLIIV